jgi:hypothetical protein
MSPSLPTSLLAKGKALCQLGLKTWLAVLLISVLGFGFPSLLQRMRAAAQPPAATPPALAPSPSPNPTALGTQGGSQSDRELAALIRQLTNRTSEGLTQTRLPGGGSKVDLEGRFQQVPLVRRDPNGSVALTCVESLEEANAFFGRNLETGEVYDKRPATAPPDESAGQAAQLGITPSELRFYQRLIEEAAQRRKLAPNAATITIQNGDGAGEGFNDATARTPEGGNTGTTLGQQRLILFNEAAAVWGAFLDSNVTTIVNAQFNPLTPCSTSGGVLGSAGTNLVFSDFDNAPFTGTWYHSALANKLAGSDQEPSDHDINATFNSSVDTGCLGAGTRFYYGLNNSTPAGTVNLFVVLLHELGHGLGFSSFANGNTGTLFLGMPDIYTRFMFDRDVNLYWNQMSNAQRATSARNNGDVLWDGANVRIASGGLTAGRETATGRVQLYTPTTFSSGSSVSHYDSACFPNLLMEPSINSGLPLDLDLTRQQMRDIGWYRDTTADLTPDTITSVTPNSGTLTVSDNATITWTNTGSFARNVTIELSTDGGTTFPVTLASNIANTGSFNWTVSNNPTAQARIRVREHNFAAPAGTSSANFTIVFNCTPITVNPSSIDPGIAGAAFSQTFMQSGGTPAINWTHTGTLPPGLTLNPGTGALTGTPTQNGSFNFTIIATDANLCTGNRPYTLTINCPAITLNPASLDNGTVNASYNQSVTASPAGTYSYAVTAGSLPAGLGLNPNTGALTGTPTAPGTSNFTITATGFGTCLGSRVYSITINCQSLTVNPPSISAGFGGVLYNQVFTQTGGAGATSFSLTGTLPTGLTFTPATATLAGIPLQSGSFPLTVTATDSNNCTGSRNYTLVINNCPSISLSPETLVPGTLNVAYSQSINASGGTAPYSFALSAGSLPNGMNLTSGGLLSGNPTQSGTFNFSVQATDANGCFGMRAYTLAINTLPTINASAVSRQQGSPASNSTIANVSDAEQALNTLSVTVNGGISATVNAVTVSNLAVDASGVVTADVAAGCTASNASFTLSVADNLGGLNNATLNVTVNPNTAPVLSYNNQAVAAGGALMINPAIAPSDNGTVSSIVLQAQGGYTGTISVNNSTGVVSISNAMPSGTHTITVRITDNCGATTDASFTLSVNCQTITLSPGSLPNGTIGQGYNQTITASGGTAPYAFTISAGTPPTGLTLSSGGTLSGTPSAAGTFNFTVQATDANGCVGTLLYNVSINTLPTISAVAVSRQQGSAASNSTIANVTDPDQALNTLAVTVNGGASATVNGVTVSGLSVNAGGVVTANVAAGCAATNASFTLTVTDNVAASNSATLTVTVTANTAPVLSYANQVVASNGSLMINPAIAPSDNGTVSSIVLQAQGSYTGTISVNNSTGVVSISNAMPSGTHTITVRITDNCGTTTDASFTLSVNCQTITLSPGSLPNGTIGQGYNQTITASGGTAPYAFTISAGTPPTGLTLSSGGTLSGTPSAAGTFNFTVQATDANGCVGTLLYNVSINTLPTISAVAVSRQQGSAASNSTIANVTDPDQALNTLAVTVNGGASATVNGVTVSGLSVNAGGVVTASVTAGCAATNASFTLTVTDNVAASNSATLTVTVTANTAPVLSYANQVVASNGSLMINPAIAPSDNGTVSSIVLHAQGGYTGTISVNNSTGVVSISNAMPSGTHTITVRITDNCGTTTDASFTLTVNCQTITLNPATLPNGTAGSSYNQTVTASGGTSPYSFTVSEGSLPSGLMLAVGGALTGTPNATGSSSFTLKATDANGCMGTLAYTLTITSANTAPTISAVAVSRQQGSAASNSTIANVTDPDQALNTLAVTVNGGASATVNGVTVSGISVDASGVVTASVVAACAATNASFTLTVTDASSATNSAMLTVTVTANTAPVLAYGNQTVVAGGSLMINPATPPSDNGTVSSIVLQAQGGYTGTISVNNSTGVVSISNAAPGGTHTITVRITDNCGTTADASFTLSVGCPTLTLTPAGPALPGGTAGMAYAQNITASGGSAPYNFSITAGALPSGLTLSTNGLLSGTPTASGDFNFTVGATDANGCSISQSYSLAIGCQPVTVNPATLANGFVGTSYNQTLTAAGGTAPYSFTVSTGALPGGLTLATGGGLTGTPATQATFNFTIRATDANGCFGERGYTVIVSGSGLMFYPLPAPVRLLDTRPGASPNACSQPNAPIPGGTSRTQAARSFCGLPANAQALTGNITTVESGGGYLTLYPSNAAQPLVANSNYGPNEILNNVFTVGLGTGDGAFKIFVTSDTDVVIDVTGYYAPPGTGGLFFHPLPKPIRLLETRAGFGGCNTPGVALPENADTTQNGRLSCDGVTIPDTALALTGNATTVNPGNGFLTLFPADATRPLVANSNYLAGQVMNAPFTVGLSAAGEFKIYPFTSTDLVIDVLGYYSAEALDVNGAGLLLTPLPKPVRLLETRPVFTGCYTPNAPLLAGSTRTQPARGGCDGVTIAANALALVGNATVVNNAAGYLTFWPSTAAQPTVATSNFTAGQVFNRHFTAGLGAGDGAFNIFTFQQTDLVIDLSGYFAP